jgi:hypothetical protein
MFQFIKMNSQLILKDCNKIYGRGSTFSGSVIQLWQGIIMIKKIVKFEFHNLSQFDENVSRILVLRSFSRWTHFHCALCHSGVEKCKLGCCI